MNTLLAILVLAGCFALLAIGFILAKKTLKKGCSLGPDCACKNIPEKNPSEDCDHLKK